MELGVPVDEVAVRRRLADVVSGLDRDRQYKVRVRLSATGALDVESVPLDPTPDPAPTLLADDRVDSTDRLLRHKTSRRGRYDGARQRASEAGYWEVLFRNERGEVTEGSFTNVFVQSGSSWLTPPLSSGLLPGVFRQELLDTRDGAREEVLYPEDLRDADAVWLCNSVRGLVRARVTVGGASPS